MSLVHFFFGDMREELPPPPPPTYLELIRAKINALEFERYYLNQLVDPFSSPLPSSSSVSVKEDTAIIVNERRYFRRVQADGDYAVAWVVDGDVSCCMACGTEFYLNFLRKHHCRACGNLVCDECSPYQGQVAPLVEEGGSRICKECFLIRSEQAYAEDEDAAAVAAAAAGEDVMNLSANSIDFAAIYQQVASPKFDSSTKKLLAAKIPKKEKKTEVTADSNTVVAAKKHAILRGRQQQQHHQHHRYGHKNNLRSRSLDFGPIKPKPPSQATSRDQTALSLTLEKDDVYQSETVSELTDPSPLSIAVENPSFQFQSTDAIKSSPETDRSSAEDSDSTEPRATTPIGGESRRPSKAMLAPFFVPQNLTTFNRSFTIDHSRSNQSLSSTDSLINLLKSGKASKAKALQRKGCEPMSLIVASELLGSCLESVEYLEEDLETIALLVETYHADVNYQDIKGRTPLRKVIQPPRESVGAYLISKGADVLHVDEEGLCCLAIALELKLDWVLHEFETYHEEELLQSTDVSRIGLYLSCLATAGYGHKLASLVERRQIDISPDDASDLLDMCKDRRDYMREPAETLALLTRLSLPLCESNDDSSDNVEGKEEEEEELLEADDELEVDGEFDEPQSSDFSP